MTSPPISGRPRQTIMLADWPQRGARCHAMGSPGAASSPGLSALAGDYIRQARIALAATETAIATRLDPDDDASLCNGRAGLVETLLVGGTALDDPSLTQLAQRAAATSLTNPAERLHLTRDFVRANPSLMLGAAGTGLQLLRLYSPGDVRSVLGGP
jgi:hypothetical protein